MIRALAAVLIVAAVPAGRAAAQDYQIQVGDTLEISVLEDPGLNRQALVRPDGKISLPLAGTVQAAGRTPEAVQAAVVRALADDFVAPPTVTVALTRLAETPEAAAVEEAGLATIYVIGAVNSPGRYDVALPLDVLQALAIAGGPGVFAARDRIQVRRRVENAESVLMFDYDLVESGAAPSAPIDLAEGDVIVVPERSLFD